MFDDDPGQDYPISEALRDFLWGALVGVVLMVVAIGCVLAVQTFWRVLLHMWRAAW
jgi:hypothetical protein